MPCCPPPSYRRGTSNCNRFLYNAPRSCGGPPSRKCCYPPPTYLCPDCGCCGSSKKVFPAIQMLGESRVDECGKQIMIFRFETRGASASSAAEDKEDDDCKDKDKEKKPKRKSRKSNDSGKSNKSPSGTPPSPPPATPAEVGGEDDYDPKSSGAEEEEIRGEFDDVIMKGEDDLYGEDEGGGVQELWKKGKKTQTDGNNKTEKCQTDDQKTEKNQADCEEEEDPWESWWQCCKDGCNKKKKDKKDCPEDDVNELRYEWCCFSCTIPGEKGPMCIPCHFCFNEESEQQSRRQGNNCFGGQSQRGNCCGGGGGQYPPQRSNCCGGQPQRSNCCGGGGQYQRPQRSSNCCGSYPPQRDPCCRPPWRYRRKVHDCTHCNLDPCCRPPKCNTATNCQQQSGCAQEESTCNYYRAKFEICEPENPEEGKKKLCGKGFNIRLGACPTEGPTTTQSCCRCKCHNRRSC